MSADYYEDIDDDEIEGELLKTWVWCGQLALCAYISFTHVSVTVFMLHMQCKV